jgi:hypothetical protein
LLVYFCRNNSHLLGNELYCLVKVVCEHRSGGCVRDLCNGVKLLQVDYIGNVCMGLKQIQVDQ